jgi:serine/threonine-protein kinase
VSGLAYAHAQGVVHRDVKPGNIFLVRGRDGSVRTKILDFGLAKILESDQIGVRPSVETQMGVHFCSPSYGAPEQFTQKAGPIGPWTDIYSLTIVLLEMLTGGKVRPAGNLAQGLIAAMDPATGSPTASSLGLKMPPAVEDLLHRAVAINPLERPRDAGVFWTALKDVMKSAPPAVLAAMTIADASVADAMEKIRAEAIARAEQKAANKTSSPFAGTMLMTNAPAGAPHLGPPGTDPMSPPMDAPRPAAGSPLAASVLSSPPPPQPQPPQRSPAAATAMGAMPPQAPPGTLPLAGPPPHAPPQISAPPQQPPMRSAAPPAMAPPRSLAPRPSMAQTKAKGSSAGMIVLVLFVLLVFFGGVGSAVFMYLRHR